MVAPRQGEEAATAKVKNPKVVATVLSALVVLGAVGPP